MKRFNFSPEFKAQAQKWGLFGSLVATLGFNLSWNPDMVHITRHESTVHTLDLAETAAPKDQKTTETKIGTDVDLSKIDSRLKYVITVSQGTGNSAIGKIKKKTDTNGTTDDCVACTLAKLKVDSGFKMDDLNAVNAAVVTYVQEHQKELLDASDKDKGSDKDKSASSDDKCSGKKGSRLLDCKMELYKTLVSTCGDKKSKDSKDDAAKDSCNEKIDDAFATIEEAYKTCTTRSRSKSEDVGFGSSGAASIDCDSLQDFVTEVVLPESPSFAQVNKSLKFINKRVNMELTAKQAEFRAMGLQPFDINKRMAAEIDMEMGTAARYNMQTGKWEVSPVPQAQICTGYGQCDEPLGHSVLDAMLENPNFTSEQAATKAFLKNLYAPYSALRARTLANPAGTGGDLLTNYNFDSVGGGATAPDNLPGRVRGGSVPLPPPPGAAGAGTGTPSYSRPGMPSNTMLPPTSTLQSPAQRGSLNQWGTL